MKNIISSTIKKLESDLQIMWNDLAECYMDVNSKENRKWIHDYCHEFLNKFDKNCIVICNHTNNIDFEKAVHISVISGTNKFNFSLSSDFTKKYFNHIK